MCLERSLPIRARNEKLLCLRTPVLWAWERSVHARAAAPARDAFLGGTRHERANSAHLLSAFPSRRYNESLLEEGKMMHRLRHSRVVKLLGVIIEEGNYSLVMEYMEKGNLMHVLKAEVTRARGALAPHRRPGAARP